MRFRSLLVLACVAAGACSGSAQTPKQQGPSDVVATVGSASITLADVDAHALTRSADDFGTMRLSQALYQARRSAIADIVGDMLLDAEARARGIDKATLVQREISSKVPIPTEADISAWYRGNPQRVQNASLDQVRTPIRNLLLDERTQAARESFLDTLKAKTPVHVTLEPPREKVAEAGRPATGPAGAKIEMIEFSDFQCPYCFRAFPVVKQVLQTYGDKIRFVYRNYPLPTHPQARPAAEAGLCAAEQGKFWEYHDRLFGNQDKLSDSDLKQHAIALGLNAGQFTDCVNTRKYQKDVDADIAAGNELGVNGTPAFFINGRALDGAQPFEAFKQVIDEELQK